MLVLPPSMRAVSVSGRLGAEKLVNPLLPKSMPVNEPQSFASIVNAPPVKPLLFSRYRNASEPMLAKSFVA